jgi:DNA-binding IclR family transcriptional regulator
MGRSTSTEDHEEGAAPAAKAPSGSQTLFRGLDVLEVVADGPLGLADLAARLGLTRSTTHRLAAGLVERRYLTFVPREGYSLGPKLLELGYQAREQLDIVRVARPYLEALAAYSEDTVHLGVLDGSAALYLDKIPGSRRISISSRVGERHPLTTTGLGKALLLDADETRWREQFQLEAGKSKDKTLQDAWVARMQQYAKSGHAYDLEENEDRVRCVASAVRGADGRIMAAISVSSAAQYMDEARMEALSHKVRQICAEISREVGWRGAAPPAAVSSAPTRRKAVAAAEAVAAK